MTPLEHASASIALPANEFDLKFVVAHVGHADSSMTTDVYAQLHKKNPVSRAFSK